MCIYTVKKQKFKNNKFFKERARFHRTSQNRRLRVKDTAKTNKD